VVMLKPIDPYSGYVKANRSLQWLC